MTKRRARKRRDPQSDADVSRGRSADQADTTASASDMPPGKRSVVGRVMFVLAVIVAVLGVATLRVVVHGEREIELSNQALDRGDAHEAIVRARRAARWYAPGAPHVGVAYVRLVALARAAEENRRDDLALLAWRGVRVAVIETRGLVSPHRDKLDQADIEIARIMAKQPEVAVPDERVRAEVLAGLKRQRSTHTLWLVALVGGFLLLALGLGLWGRQVGGSGGRLHWSGARAGIVLTILGAALWLVAVWRA